MDGSLFAPGLSRGLLSTSRVYHPWALPSLTKQTYDALFPTIPEAAVRHRHLVLVGRMESGKSTALNAIAREALRRYDPRDVNLIATYSTPDAIERINSQPVQLICIDDAVREANSRTSGRQAEEIGDFFRIRHIYEQRSMSEAGVVITIYATQRFKSLDLVYRDGTIIIFKTTPTDPDEKRFIMDYVGPAAFAELNHITDRIYHHADDLAKSSAVACFTSTGKVGTFKYEMGPKVLDFSHNNPLAVIGEQFTFTAASAVEQLRQIPAWRRRANIYWDYIRPDAPLDYEALSAKYKVVKPNISKAISAVRGELSRLGGAEYEAWKAEQLRGQGYTITHDGTRGAPDIYGTDPHGAPVVMSCKCMEFERLTKLPLDEVRPELHKAAELRTSVILSVYNLRDRREQEIRIDPTNPPAIIELRP